MTEDEMRGLLIWAGGIKFKFKPGDLIRFVDVNKGEGGTLPFSYGIVRKQITSPAVGYKVEPVAHDYVLYGSTCNWGEKELELVTEIHRLCVNRYDWSVDWPTRIITEFTKGE